MKFMLFRNSEKDFQSIGEITATVDGVITFNLPDAIADSLKVANFLRLKFTPEDGLLYLKALVLSKYQASREHFELDEADEVWTTIPVDKQILEAWVYELFAAKGIDPKKYGY